MAQREGKGKWGEGKGEWSAVVAAPNCWPLLKWRIYIVGLPHVRRDRGRAIHWSRTCHTMPSVRPTS